MRWSQLKTNLESLRAPILGKRVGLHQARYRYTLEEVGRIWLTIDGREIASFDTSSSEYDDYRALEDLKRYLALPIDDALRSSGPLLRALAVIDRRVGKRRLRSLDIGPEEHPLVHELYRLRCEAEGIPSGTSFAFLDGRSELMPQGDKRKYTDKQKRQAEHIEEGYRERGLSEGEAERRAWATVNKVHGGGETPGGGGYGKPENREPMRRGARKAAKKR
jgi:hypothetical protein